MAAMVWFKPCGIKFRKGVLFGIHEQHRILTVDFLLLRIVFLGYSSTRLTFNAIKGLARDEDWMIKNMSSVKRAAEEGRKQAFDEHKAARAAEFDRMKKDCINFSEENMHLRTENHALRNAIKIVQEDSEV